MSGETERMRRLAVAQIPDVVHLRFQRDQEPTPAEQALATAAIKRAMATLRHAHAAKARQHQPPYQRKEF